jgi:hypothetical protein
MPFVGLSECCQFKIYKTENGESMRYIYPIIQCECGGKYKDVESLKQKHLCTKKHQNFINGVKKKTPSQIKKEWRSASGQNEKFNCECGGKYTQEHFKNHTKTKRHQNYISNL